VLNQNKPHENKKSPNNQVKPMDEANEKLEKSGDRNRSGGAVSGISLENISAIVYGHWEPLVHGGAVAHHVRRHLRFG